MINNYYVIISDSISLTSQFCKVELGLKFTSWYGIRVYHSKVVGPIGSPAIGRYRTTFTYKFHARVEESQREESVGDLTLIKDEAFQ